MKHLYHCHRPWQACRSFARHCWKDVRKTGNTGSVWLRSVRKAWSTAWCDPALVLLGSPHAILLTQSFGKSARCLKGWMTCFIHGNWPKNIPRLTILSADLTVLSSYVVWQERFYYVPVNSITNAAC